MDSPQYEIACILINYNSSTHTMNCINSIVQNTSKSLTYQIIIIDNASEIDDYNKLVKYHKQLNNPDIKLVRSKINTGFGGGNMFGVQYANAKYYAFINNDTYFINDCLSILKIEFEKHNDVAIVGGQSYTEIGVMMQAFDHFASLSKEFLGRDFLEKINPKKYPKRKKEYSTPTLVNYVQGSFMLVKAIDFNTIGGFDTNIFLYYEETDLGIRLYKNNKKCLLVPEAKYVHLHGASTPQNILIKTELKISLLYIIRKHYGYFAYQILLNYLRLNYLFSSLLKPKYFYLFKVLLAGAPLSSSLKQKQVLK